MLVLARKIGQSIVIGNGITVTILGIRGDQVRLGIEAPRSLPVHRQEVYAQITAENQAASEVGVESLQGLDGLLAQIPGKR